MRIGELAAKTGVSVRSLRYYEEQGLLVAQRSGSGQRHYAEVAVERVRMIQEMYAAGMTSQVIGGMLPCLATGEVSPQMVDRLAEQRERIDRSLRELQSARDRLDGVIASAASARRSSYSE